MRHASDAEEHDRHRSTRPRSTYRRNARIALRKKRTRVLLSAGLTFVLAVSVLATIVVQGVSRRDSSGVDPHLAAVSTAVATTAAATPVSQQVSAPDVADTYVVASQPTAVKGAKKWTYATKSENRTFLKFDTAAVVPAGMVVRAATLRIYALYVATTAAGFEAHPLTGTWSESATTAQNRPAFTAAAASPTVSVPGSQRWISLSINASAVDTKAATSLELAHIVSGSALQLASRESSKPPTLDLELVSSSLAVTAAPTTTTTTTTTTTSSKPTTAPAQAPEADVASPGDLPFNLPSTSTLASSKRLVFAHYMPPFRRSIDNKPPSQDYWQQEYLDPMGESGKHKSYGGFTRDRPLGRAPLSGDYEAKDLQAEVQQARSAGIDGFAVDLLSITSGNWSRALNLLKAAEAVDSSFKIMAMPDMTMLDDESPGALASAIAKFDKYPAAFHLADGRLVVSPFKTENHSASWWKDWLSLLRNSYGVDVAFVPTFLDWQKYADDYDSFSYGVGHWGTANPDAAANTAKHIRLAHDRGKIWMAPVRVQDVRPNQKIYDEADNSRTLRLTWQGVIDGGADWVQIPTWNDYTEGSAIAPSAHHGWAYLDMSSYYITKWKTGSYPTIKRDGLYVVHRTQTYQASPSFPQAKLMSLRSGTPGPVNQVEVVAFLTEPGTVTVKVGSSTYTWDASAGVSAKDFPLSAGTISASVQRGGDFTTSVTSPYTVSSSPYVQNLEYAAVSSLR
jgi:hypothetical protein